MATINYETIAICFAAERNAAIIDGEPDPAHVKGCWFGLFSRISNEIWIDNPQFDIDAFFDACCGLPEKSN